MWLHRLEKDQEVRLDVEAVDGILTFGDGFGILTVGDEDQSLKGLPFEVGQVIGRGDQTDLGGLRAAVVGDRAVGGPAGVDLTRWKSRFSRWESCSRNQIRRPGSGSSETELWQVKQIKRLDMENQQS